MQKPLDPRVMFRILRLRRAGHTIRTIATTLKISVGSVGNYLDSAYRNWQLGKRKMERARSRS